MRLPLLLIFCVSLLFVTNCKPDKEDCFEPSDPKCENYDPCYGKKPVTAEIEIGQKMELGPFLGDSIIYISDSIFPTTEIRFNSPLNGAKYTWTLGAESITSQSFLREFYSVPFGEYSVKLVVEKDADKNCFPSDNGMDTITKKFKIVPLCSLAIFGVFKGKWDGSNQDSSIITIKNFKDFTYTDSCKYGLYRYTNLTGVNDTFIGSGIPTSNTELIKTESSFGNLGESHFKINPQTNQIVFEYTYASQPYIFRGRKIAD